MSSQTTPSPQLSIGRRRTRGRVIGRLLRMLFPRPHVEPAPAKPIRLADVDPVMRDLEAQLAALKHKHGAGAREIAAKRRARLHEILAGTGTQ